MSFVLVRSFAPRVSRLGPLLVTLALGSCGVPTDTGQTASDDLRVVQLGDLNVVRLRQDAPPLEASTVSFYARRGEDRTGSVYFSDGRGGRGGEYLRLEISAGSLESRPDGTPIAMGDSVRITIRITDPQRMQFTLEPHGLKFATLSPARLTASYAEADPDLNGDGRVDITDYLIEMRLGIYRQITLADPFVRLSSILDLQLDVVASSLPGFSQYAVAY